MKKVLTVLAVLTVFTAPALAQSFDPDNGTGNLLTFSPSTAKNEKVAAGRSGLHSFAMVSSRAKLSVSGSSLATRSSVSK